MLRFVRALTLPLALLLAAAPALAADNWTVKDSTGATVTLRSKDTGAGQAQYHVLADGTGTAYSSTNPLAALLNAGTAHVGSFNIDQFGGTAVSLGQKASAVSIPVVLPSDGTQATATAQATGNTSLASIDAKTPALATLPTLANQAAGNTSLATIATNTAGLATATGQTATNTKLDTIIGQAAPSGALGATPPNGTLFPWFQQPPGATYNIAGTVTTQSGTSLVSPAYRIGLSVAGNNAQVFTPSGVVTPKKMLHAYFCNKATADRVLKFYDKSAAPVPGTDTVVTSIYAPVGACPVIDFSSGGFPFANGLAVAVTAGGDGDTGSTVAAGDIVGLNIQHN